MSTADRLHGFAIRIIGPVPAGAPGHESVFDGLSLQETNDVRRHARESSFH
jgi:hypothetical protein